MKNAQLKKITKTLVTSSLTNGKVDEKKVTKILSLLTKEKPTGLIAILKRYKKQIENKIKHEEVIVESSTLPQNIERFKKELISKTKASNVIFKINNDLIFGTKVTCGDWIFDSTLDNKLNQIAKV